MSSHIKTTTNEPKSKKGAKITPSTENEEYKSTIYYSLNINSNIAVLEVLQKYGVNTNNFDLNDHFHITVLFTGGKIHENSKDLDALLGKAFNVNVDRMAVSRNYITFGVNWIKSAENWKDIPYFGNEIKHITIGITKDTDKKGKKLRPVFSPSAFTEGECINIEEELILESTLSIVKN